MKRFAIVGLLVGGCVGAETAECPGGGVCPSGTVCGFDRGMQSCIPELCGNGVVEPPGEDCDDGNTDSGDGCEATCRGTLRPPVRRHPVMAYDPHLHQLVMFGGSRSPEFYDDTWIWDGVAWTKITSSIPPGRWGASMAYDSTRNRAVMFGGYGADGQALDDLWEWDGTAPGWFAVTPALLPKPSPRGVAAMAYDSTRHTVVLFGGFDGVVPLGDTWEWDGVSWSQQSPSTTPGERLRAAMTFDTSRGEALLVGGGDVDNTWMWNGIRWSTLAGAGAPPFSRDGGMVFDARDNRAIYYGGNNGTVPNTTWGGVWELAGSAWTELTTDGAPPPRSSFGIAYDSDLDAVLVFGGSGPMEDYNDLWSLHDGMWRQLQ